MEVCASIKSVKYLFKYIYKGHDIGNITITGVAANALDPEAHVGTTEDTGPPPLIDPNVNAAAPTAIPLDPAEAPAAGQRASEPFRDETVEHLTGRFMGASESSWRLYAFDLHGRGSSVVRLTVHLLDERAVEFDEEAELQSVLERGSPKTMLTAWFELNQRDPEARNILYMDIPSHYVWKDKTSGSGADRVVGAHWRRRINRLTYPTIGRMYSVARSQVCTY